MLGHWWLAFFIAVIGSGIVPLSIVYGDKRTLPASVREYCSPSSKYLLQLVSENRISEAYSTARLYSSDEEGNKTLVWQIDRLPHRIGPASALVSNSGRVVLVDEWVNTLSPLAIVVLDQSGKSKAIFSFTDIARQTGLAEADMVTSAKIGAWQSEAAVLDLKLDRIIFKTSQKSFAVDLKSGKFETL